MPNPCFVILSCHTPAISLDQNPACTPLDLFPGASANAEHDETFPPQ
jgi:hypothetical protein